MSTDYQETADIGVFYGCLGTAPRDLLTTRGCLSFPAPTLLARKSVDDKAPHGRVTIA